MGLDIFMHVETRKGGGWRLADTTVVETDVDSSNGSVWNPVASTTADLCPIPSDLGDPLADDLTGRDGVSAPVPFHWGRDGLLFCVLKDLCSLDATISGPLG